MISTRHPILSVEQMYDLFRSKFGEYEDKTDYIFYKKKNVDGLDVQGYALPSIFVGRIDEFYAPQEIMVPYNLLITV